MENKYRSRCEYAVCAARSRSRYGLIVWVAGKTDPSLTHVLPERLSTYDYHVSSLPFTLL